MSSYKIIPKTSYKRSTWKNGLGFTDEIAIYPADANLSQGNFLWRLSSAQIEKASPFSLFPNHDRILLVLKGAGLRLFHTIEEGSEDDVNEIPALQPYDFPGDLPSRCELLNGPITDFSIFLRRGEVEPDVQIMEVKSDEPLDWAPYGKWNFAFVLSGSLKTDAGILQEGDTLSGEGAIQLHATTPITRLLLISLSI